ncbi:MAG: hypothetical protein Fur0010_04440 [Bdellovibrio sp.]
MIQSVYANFDLSQEERELLNRIEVRIDDEKEKLEEKIEKIDEVIAAGKDQLKDRVENLEASVDEIKSEVEGVAVEGKKGEIEGKLSDLKEKSKNELEKFKKDLDSEKEKLKREIEKEKKILVDTAKNEFIPGMGLSLFSLMATAVVAPLMAYICFDQPSVKIYTAGAAYYLFKELSQWKKFKVGMMMTMERIEKIDFDDNQSIRDNVSSGKSFLRSQLDFMDGQLDILKNGFEAIEKKAVNAKHVSYAYAAAGGTALLETYAFGGGVCKGLGENKTQPIHPLMEILVPSAIASDEKKMDYAGDIDKLGIVIGGLVSAGLVLAIYKGYFPSIKEMLKLGGTRSALFLANSGIALFASKKLKEASKIYLDRINEIKALVAKLRVKLEEGTDKIDRFLDKLDKLAEALSKYGITSPKKLTDMSVNELKEFVKTIDPVKSNFDGNDLNLLEEVRLYLNVKTSFHKSNKPHFKIGFTHLFYYFISQANAKECGFQNGRLNIVLDEKCQCQDKKRCAQSSIDLIKNNQSKSLDGFMISYKAMTDADYHGSDLKNKYQKVVELYGPQLAAVNEGLKKNINASLVKSGKQSFPFNEIEKAVQLKNNRALNTTYQNVQKRGLFNTKFISADLMQSKNEIKKRKQELTGATDTYKRPSLSARDLKLLKGIREKLMRGISSQNNAYNVEYNIDESVEKNTSRDIFEMISKRYMLKIRELEH